MPVSPSVPAAPLLWRDGWQTGARVLAQETAIAITYNRVTHAVMMATPSDLEDFAAGFSLAEGIVTAAGDIEDFACVEAEQGLELRLWIAPELMTRLEQRRRRLAGATGCGMCGLESLDDAMRPPPPVPAGGCVHPETIMQAMAAMAPAQSLGRETRAVHAAGFWAGTLVALREDVGRHNALDKLAGAMARSGRRAAEGVLVLSSRLSVELVQKAARMGAPVVAGVSAPTAHAVRLADDAGMTLIGVARADGFEVFTHPHRLTGAGT